ncbi:CAAD domain-containing protein [Aetokthonos hydrillicola Thurmond2011]|uniref:CAAD domain-containing protein n=1 Tax=Aetokthonos hydrillicola Thurmond2011 TaxID=2712845 RepID=A0AAP5IDE0_9CYAN|nr:CAAD domain-containing protein [Aetokthonos hydrillicola]MBO3463424.1 hypothetical protein [Aetokthonos hydrillicola CCALA 1050]MBW4585700.1 CAAD domain-containing protein [Aetokthonos hydrillicola CCALA 1050]MDR9899204.1 CAAD domain-containing protein [Aetokthonos hydrillicola Thurmond2011]
MENEQQPSPSNYSDSTSTEPIASAEVSKMGTQPLLPSATGGNSQWEETAKTASDFLAQLPEYVGSFFRSYRRPILTIVLILAALVTFRILLALLDAVNDIPLIDPVFELVGIGYVTWFIFRYLLKTSTRQELAAQIRSLQNEFFGAEDS